jgi:aarF domain-containing kinase
MRTLFLSALIYLLPRNASTTLLRPKHCFTVCARSAAATTNIQTYEEDNKPKDLQLKNPLRLFQSIASVIAVPTLVQNSSKVPQWLHNVAPSSTSKMIVTSATSIALAIGVCSSSITHAATSSYSKDHHLSHLHAKKMSPIEVVSRVASFWKSTGGLICHYKFTQAWVALKKIDKPKRDEIYERLHDRYAPQALDIILNMRGLFIKVGQVLSSRPDFVPLQYVQSFTTVQDSCPSWPASEIIDIISNSLYMNQIGLKFDDLFESFESEPLGSASIGQVHKATLTPKSLEIARAAGYKGGSSVAVKVMHLDAYDRFRNDFKIFKWLCRVALPGWSPLLQEQEKQIMTEFDYRNECENLLCIRANVEDSPFKNKVLIPDAIPAFTTSNVLIMEYLDGKKLATHVEDELTRIFGLRDAAKSLLEKKRCEIFQGQPSQTSDKSWFDAQTRDCSFLQKIITLSQLGLLQRRQKRLLNLLLDVHGHQILVGKRFNGDPHGGNILVLSDGRLGLIDYGQCKTLTKDECFCLSKIMHQLGQDTINDEEVANAMKEFGFIFTNDRVDIIRETAQLFFDTDSGRKKVACSNPQEYLVHLQSLNRFTNVPDAAVFVARMSFLFRGMGLLLGVDIHTSKHWSKQIQS